jgi:F-type H+-transporting ATPase subunit b
MQINWFTVTAQMINFLILLYLLRRFLYHPMIKAMDERRERIEGKEREAQDKISAAEGRIQEYKNQSNRLEEEKNEILFSIHQQAEAEKKEFLERAREDIDIQKKLWEESIAKEQTHSLREMQRQIGLLSSQIARRALADLSGRKLERIIFDTFVDKLSSLEGKEINRLRERKGHPGTKAMVSSTFDLNEEDKDSLQQLFKKMLIHDGPIEYHIDPEMICGIKMELMGNQFEWSIGEYLRSLEDDFIKALEPEKTI